MQIWLAEQQSPVNPIAEIGKRRSGVLAERDDRQVICVEVIAERADIYGLTGKQAAKERTPASLDIGRFRHGLAFVFLADSGDDAVVAERQGAQHRLQFGGTNTDPRRLVQKAVGEQTVAGRVPPEDRIEAGSGAGSETGLHQ
jgi:hypothetical protein